jgi:hypothetical protein
MEQGIVRRPVFPVFRQVVGQGISHLRQGLFMFRDSAVQWGMLDRFGRLIKKQAADAGLMDNSQVCSRNVDRQSSSL